MRAIRCCGVAGFLLLQGCGVFSPGLPSERPPLADMELAFALMQEPDDEEQRRKLPKGSFTGLVVKAAGDTLDALAEGDGGIVVESVIENSPADWAGIRPGDLLLEASSAGKSRRALEWPSDWHELERETPPGSKLSIEYDRAGAVRRTELEMQARLRLPERHEARVFREEDRVGVVLREPTEVESHAGGLGRGGGAVVVGLSRRSPWRKAGLRFGDLLVALGGRPVGGPQAVLNSIRAGTPGERVSLEVLRDGTRIRLDAAISQRESDLRSVHLPLLFDYESERDRSEWSLLLGLFSYESTSAAWEFGFLWLFSFGGGDSDRLEEIDS